MPQLDFVIIFPQVFWLFTIFFLVYTIIVYFFLPIFVKSLKARKRIVLENSSLLLNTQSNFALKQVRLNDLLNKNFYLIKSTLEVEVFNVFFSKNKLDLNYVDTKIVKAVHDIVLYYDVNILDSIPLSPKFSSISFKE